MTTKKTAAPEPVKATRRRRIEREKAQEVLGVAERRLAALEGRRNVLTAELETADQQFCECLDQVEYLRQNPALRETATEPEVVESS